jgi:hypothetical protein
MGLIALTGNYNFFNALTVALCIPTLASDFAADQDEEEEGAKGEAQRGASTPRQVDSQGPLLWVARHWAKLERSGAFRAVGWLSGLAFLCLAARRMFRVTLGPPAPHMEHVRLDFVMSVSEVSLLGCRGETVQSQLAVHVSQVNEWVDWVLPWTIAAVACCTVLSCLVYVGRQRGVASALGASLLSIAALAMLAISVVPLVGISEGLNDKVSIVGLRGDHAGLTSNLWLLWLAVCSCPRRSCSCTSRASPGTCPAGMVCSGA